MSDTQHPPIDKSNFAVRAMYARLCEELNRQTAQQPYRPVWEESGGYVSHGRNANKKN